MKAFEKRTTPERRHSALMADALERLEHDVLGAVIAADGLPEAWGQIAGETDRSGDRVKLTMRLDRDVVKFFKAMGPGYQERIARVLRAWMHGRLAKVIAGPDTTDMVLRPNAVVARLRGEADAIAAEAEAVRKAEAVAAEASERAHKQESIDAFMAHNEELERMGLQALEMPGWVLDTIEELVRGKG